MRRPVERPKRQRAVGPRSQDLVSRTGEASIQQACRVAKGVVGLDELMGSPAPEPRHPIQAQLLAVLADAPDSQFSLPTSADVRQHSGIASVRESTVGRAPWWSLRIARRCM